MTQISLVGDWMLYQAKMHVLVSTKLSSDSPSRYVCVLDNSFLVHSFMPLYLHSTNLDFMKDINIQIEYVSTEKIRWPGRILFDEMKVR